MPCAALQILNTLILWKSRVFVVWPLHRRGTIREVDRHSTIYCRRRRRHSWRIGAVVVARVVVALGRAVVIARVVAGAGCARPIVRA